MKKKRHSGIVITLLAIIVSIGVVFSIQQLVKTYNANIESQDVPSFKRPSIGGPFSLTDHNGRSVTDKDFLGKHVLLFFGYTFCPDVCPTALTNVTDAIGLLEKRGNSVLPIFITIDPERDSAAHLGEYVKFFHPSLVALTGTREQIKAVAKAYRVYYSKAEENKDDPDDYLMDHSAITYLIGPDGKFVAHFSHGLEPEVLAERISENL